MYWLKSDSRIKSSFIIFSKFKSLILLSAVFFGHLKSMLLFKSLEVQLILCVQFYLRSNALISRNLGWPSWFYIAICLTCCEIGGGLIVHDAKKDDQSKRLIWNLILVLLIKLDPVFLIAYLSWKKLKLIFACSILN